MRKITVIIRNTPLNTSRNSEALRMSVGMTLQNENITVIFLEDGVWSASQELDPRQINSPDTTEALETLQALKVKLLAEKKAVEKHRIKLREGIQQASLEEIASILTESDIVIPF